MYLQCMTMRFLINISVVVMMIPALVESQGFYNNENFGNRSILLGGNVTGSVEDLGLTYYNPARIALIENPIFSINAKAYQYNSASLENLFGGDDKLGDSSFEGVPSMVSGTYKFDKWPKHHFAYTFLSKQRSKLGVEVSRNFDSDSQNNEFEGVEKFVGDFKLNRKTTDEWMGISWGTKLKDNLSIGASVFASFYKKSSSFDLSLATLDANADIEVYNNEIKYSQNSYGLFFKAGLAWNLEKVELGLNLDMPYLEIVNNGKYRYQRILSGTEDNSDDFQYDDYKDLRSKRKVPLGISIGAGLPFGRNKLHLKVDWHGKVTEYEPLVIPQIEEGEDGNSFSEELRSVINFGAGIELFISDFINLYGSFSTDFSPVKANAGLFDLVDSETDANFDADYFHYALGMDFKLKNVKLILGGTYSRASGEYGEPVNFWSSDVEVPENDDASILTISRWRLIIGLEIPIFGYDLEIK